MKLENIEQVNQDMLIHSNYLQSGLNSFSTQDRNLLTPNRLLNALKKRNEQFKKDLERPVVVPIPQPLRQLSQRAAKQARIANFKAKRQTAKAQLARQYSSELYWQKFTMENQQQYVDKHQEFLIHRMIAQSFNANGNTQKLIKNNFFNNLKGIKDDKAHSPSRIRSNARMEDQIKSNKYIYHDYIKRKVLSNEEAMEDISQFMHLAGEVSQIWQILFEQFKSYDYAIKSQKPNPYLAIINASIIMIEAKFRQELPSLTNQKQISQFMRKKYVSASRSQNYETNQEGILVWAIPFAYYKAGAWSNFAASLNDRGKHGITLRQEFTKFQQSLASFEPTPQYFGQAAINDVFYLQLVRIVKGITEYDEKLCALESYDLIWLALKTLNIYAFRDPNKRSDLLEIVSALSNYFLYHQDRYVSRATAIIPYAQLLYLADYKAFADYRSQTRLKKGLTPDDYVHILMAITSKPEIIGDQQIYNDLVEQLQQQLQHYLANLLTTNSKKQDDERIQEKDYTVFYLMCIPLQHFKNVITAVFTSWDRFNEINNCIIEGLKGWNYIKFRFQFSLNSQRFEDAILSVLKNMMSSEHNSQVHLKIVEAAQTLLSQSKNYINFVLLCQTHHLLKLKQAQQSATRSLRYETESKQTNKVKSIYQKLNHTLNEILQRDENIQQEFKPLVQFLKSYCSLEDIRHEKNVTKLEHFLKDEEYVRDLILLASRQRNPIKQFYQKLIEFNAEKLFFVYVKNVIYGQERVNHMRGNYNQLKSYKDSIKKAINTISKQTNYDISPYIPYLSFEMYQ